jgi:CDP-diacylglycerol--glycerol-3-phosphate 3-phosphatidyltransferase
MNNVQNFRKTMPTLYDLKPRFQDQLRPLAQILVQRGVTANQVTLAAIALSVATGALLAAAGDPRLFFALPILLLLRMGLNAIDGMMAREHGQASRLGDVISDIALILPFAFLPQFPAAGVVAFTIAACLSEFAGVLAIGAGSSRRYDGPMGKSDRALALGMLSVVVGAGVTISEIVSNTVFPLLAFVALVTMANRIRQAIRST